MDETLAMLSAKAVPGAAPVAGIAAFGKFMCVLQQVADAARPPGMAELAARSGYPRPTVYRIVAGLLEHGLIVARADGTYVLGPRLLSLAGRSWARFDLRVALLPDLRALRDSTGQTVHLAVPAGDAMVYIEKLDGPGAVRMASRIGGQLPLHCSAVGKACLAALPPAALDAWLARAPLPRLTPGTLTAAPALRAELARVRRLGYAVDNEENEAGIVCYGVALCDAGGRALAGVSVSTLPLRRAAEPPSAYIEALLRLRAAAADRLAGMPAPPAEDSP
ncbi:helix-turn-helix domain-containing protein [Bordetella petrii]|nr:helix-turn-helix domain-containing protein [Bordetella petrii]